MLVKTLFIFLITLFACSEFLLGTSLIQRPIILGPLVGLVFGQLELGIVMGATLELAFIGAVSIGAYIPPDMISGTILGTALAIQAGTGPETALALGLPISTVMLALNSVVGSPIMLTFTHLMDKDIEEGNVAKFKFHYFFGGYCSFAARLIVIPCAFYFRWFNSSIRICDVSTDDLGQKDCSILLHRFLRSSIFRIKYNSYRNFHIGLCSINVL